MNYFILQEIFDLSNFSKLSLVDISLIIIIFSIILLVFAGLIILFKKILNKDKKSIKEILTNLKSLKKKNPVNLNSKTNESKKINQIAKEETIIVDKKNSQKINNSSSLDASSLSLKQLLINKFKPIIESQLKTRIVVIDFKSEDKNFSTIIEIDTKRLQLTLDSFGNIIDYKRLKSN
ncbi:MAG: hypothetical protein PHQ98_00770 [Candidatus ainarchaeum sp.]|nr:hypothetical protein [Candidatus ainarchaeum sp.]